jgi:hypothetical protein
MDHNDGERPRTSDTADMKNRPGQPGLSGVHAAESVALVHSWLRLSEQLTPLIGESGFCALFGRALRLSTVRFERLSSCDSARPVADLLMSLTRTLNEIGPEQAAAANSILLDTFTTLLGNLIGEALTKQLLNVATVSADGQKHGQEQK